MIEMIFAIAVIGIGLLAACTLVFSNLALSLRDKDEVVAINLAREGLELSKNLRDSNWLAGNAFDAGLIGSGTPKWNGVDSGFSFNFPVNDFSDSRTKIMFSDNAAAPKFMANYDSGVTGATSTFSRLIVFHPICNTLLVLDPPATCAGSGLSKIGVRVESHIQWSLQGRLKDTVMYDDLYDWR